MAVYFITRPDRGHVKIGRSTNPEKRFTDLASGFSSEELVLRAAIPGAADEETVLHRRFKEQRLRGEWFEINDELNSVIALAEVEGHLSSLEWFSRSLEDKKSCNVNLPEKVSLALAENVRRLRLEMGFTQSALAAECGMPRETCANLESRKANPTLGVLLKVCRIFNVTVDELITGEVSP